MYVCLSVRNAVTVESLDLRSSPSSSTSQSLVNLLPVHSPAEEQCQSLGRHTGDVDIHDVTSTEARVLRLPRVSSKAKSWLSDGFEYFWQVDIKL